MGEHVFVPGRRYKWVNMDDVSTYMPLYWEDHNITDNTFVVECVDSKGNVIYTRDGITHCLAAQFRLRFGDVVPYGFKTGHRYQIKSFNPRDWAYSAIHRYWRYYNITDCSFVAQFVDESGDVFAKTHDNKMKMILEAADFDKYDIVEL